MKGWSWNLGEPLRPRYDLWSLGGTRVERPHLSSVWYAKAQWHLSRDDHQFGPYSRDQILQMAKRGVLQSHDLLWSRDWTPASDIAGLLKPPSPLADTPSHASSASSLKHGFLKGHRRHPPAYGNVGHFRRVHNDARAARGFLHNRVVDKWYYATIIIVGIVGFIVAALISWPLSVLKQQSDAARRARREGLNTK